MASAISHGLVAVALAQAGPAALRRNLWFWIQAIFCSVLPDIDVLGFALGIRYGDVLGHRGLTHSLIFALMVGCWSAAQFRRHPVSLTRLALLYTLITASHGCLDALTNGGLGVAFFSPWNPARYFFPWRPVAVSPIGLKDFFHRGWPVLRSEMLWIWGPALLIGISLFVWKKRACAKISS